MALTPATPAVVVPDDPAMATEPARTVGQMFADRVMVRSLVSAIIGIVALVAKVAVDDTLVDNITTAVTLGAMVAAAGFAQWDARKRALAQAERTRKEVYAPATVVRKAEQAVAAGGVDVVTLPRGESLPA